MPEPIFPPQEPPMRPPNRVRWTREQCASLHDARILIGRYELMNGDILSKGGQTPAHAYVIRMLMTHLVTIFGGNRIQCQLPIHIPGSNSEYSEPEPDCAVLARPFGEFVDHHPSSLDLHLVVEVSDSSLNFDLKSKALLYANAGIIEYWIINLISRRLLVLRKPDSTGYASIIAYSETELCAPLASPSNSVLVADLLPPR